MKNKIAKYTVPPVVALSALGYLVYEKVYLPNEIPSAFLTPLDPNEMPQELNPDQPTIITANDGTTLLAKMSSGAERNTTDYQELKSKSPESAKFLYQAVVANEDSRFETNGGCDARGLVRAGGFTFGGKAIRLFNKVSPIDIGNVPGKQGGSTITRQVISNKYVPPTDEQLLNGDPKISLVMLSGGNEIDPATGKPSVDPITGRPNKYKARDYAEQLHECRAAMTLYDQKGPEGVFEDHMNVVYWGRNAYTAQDAAMNYFGVSLEQLNRQQATILASVLPGPSRMDVSFTDSEMSEEKKNLHDIYMKELAIKLLTDSALEEQEVPLVADNQEEQQKIDSLRNDIRSKISSNEEAIYERQKEITGKEFENGLEILVGGNKISEQQSTEITNYRKAKREWNELNRRYKLSIGRQLSVGFIDDREAAELRETPIQLIEYKLPKGATNDFSGADALGARHYMDYAMPQIKEILEKEGFDPDKINKGLHITLSLDPEQQKATNDVIKSQSFVKESPLDMASATISSDGAIMAMYGGKDYASLQFNYATQARRSIGSAMKQFPLSLAYRDGILTDKLQGRSLIKPGEEISWNRPVTVYGGDFSADKEVTTGQYCSPPEIEQVQCTPSRAHGLSDNEFAGLTVQGRLKETAEYMSALGAEVPESNIGASMFLGVEIPMQQLALATGNLVLNKGRYIPSYTVQQIKVAGLNEEEDRIIYEYTPVEPVNVLEDDRAADYTTQSMIEVVASGTAKDRIELPQGPDSVAYKTGTGSNKEDLTGVGAKCNGNERYTRALWAGDPRALNRIESISSSAVLASIWNDIESRVPQAVGACSLLDGSGPRPSISPSPSPEPSPSPTPEPSEEPSPEPTSELLPEEPLIEPSEEPLVPDDPIEPEPEITLLPEEPTEQLPEQPLVPDDDSAETIDANEESRRENEETETVAQGLTATIQAVANHTDFERLAQCESGGKWDINTGNGYYGGLQFSAATWKSVGGAGLPHQAPKTEQLVRGQLLLDRSGWGQWPACARKLGLMAAR